MPNKKAEIIKTADAYDSILSSVVELLEQSRRLAARSVNAVMTATYWEIGRRIVEVEQQGEKRAEYGESLLKKLSEDLTKRFGRGFSQDNLEKMRLFYSSRQISETISTESAAIPATLSRKFNLTEIAKRFPLPWSHYVLLLSYRDEDEREFYPDEKTLIKEIK